MKKVLIVTDNLPNQINGVVTTYKNIERIALNDGYEFHYLDPTYFKNFDCPRYKDIKLSFPLGIGKIIEKIEPDHIHIATEGPIGIATKVYLKKRSIRYNTAYHTKFPEIAKKLLFIPEFITWPLLRWFHDHDGKVLTTTKNMADELKDNGFGDNVIAWTRGVDRDIFKFNGNPPSDLITLLYVGRVSREKNMEDFFNIRIDNSKKIVVGDGPMLEEYKRDFPDVEFVGVKTGAQLASYYQSADVFVFPSKADTFGIVNIEAMACGTPVAAYPVRGPSESVVTGVNGCLEYDLTAACLMCLKLDRGKVYESSKVWSWENSWAIFKYNLV